MEFIFLACNRNVPPTVGREKAALVTDPVPSKGLKLKGDILSVKRISSAHTNPTYPWRALHSTCCFVIVSTAILNSDSPGRKCAATELN